MREREKTRMRNLWGNMDRYDAALTQPALPERYQPDTHVTPPHATREALAAMLTALVPGARRTALLRQLAQ
jgi:hypothetical protein